MASTTTVVGHLLATLINEIKAKASGINTIKTFCVGHSLGAHVCGFAGKSLRDGYGGPQVDGILGIDPAGPIFEDNDEDNKLWRGKAKVITLTGKLTS